MNRPDLHGDRPFVVAHRGGAAEAPENTLAAFRRAIARGFPWAECDVRAAADGTPIVVHDEAVPLRGGGAPVPVASLPLARLRDVDLGRAHGPAAAGETPPTLDALLALPWGGTRLMVEIKPTSDDAGLGSRTAQDVLRVLANDRVVFASFAPEVLAAVRRAAADAALMALIDADTPPSAFAAVPVVAFGVDRRLVTPALVADLATAGRVVWSWTIAEAAQADALIRAGVRGLITDVPTALTARLRP